MIVRDFRSWLIRSAASRSRSRSPHIHVGAVPADWLRRATRTGRPAAGEKIDAGARNRDRIIATSGRECRRSNDRGLSVTEIVQASAPTVSGHDLKFMRIDRCRQPDAVATEYFDSKCR
jgi:hypothetical protein